MPAPSRHQKAWTIVSSSPTKAVVRSDEITCIRFSRLRTARQKQSSSPTNASAWPDENFQSGMTQAFVGPDECIRRARRKPSLGPTEVFV